jgi:uncharacterized protein (TIGR02996 family)
MAGEALLRAIQEDPHDDGPRLVYADWLEEEGDQARAEFIRVQCELARLGEDDPSRSAVQKRERQLLRAHRAAWVAEKPALAGRHVEFVRGFLAPLLVESVPSFVRRHPEELGHAPLWHFTLHSLANAPDRLDQVAALTDCPLLRRAVTLRLSNNAIGIQGAERFATCPHLGNVTTLGLVRNWIHREGMLALAKTASWPRVTNLDLGCNRIEDKGVAALARMPFLANVTHLDLHFDWLRDGACEALAGSPYLGKLLVLALHENSIGDRGAAALAEAPWTRGLKVLSLANQMGNAGAEALARSPYLDGLERLELKDNHRLTTRGARALRKRFGERVVLPGHCWEAG